MSTDARHTQDSLVAQVGDPRQINDAVDSLAGRVEVLIRLPDLRNQQSAAKLPPKSPRHEDKPSSKNSNSDSSGLLGPILDTLRDRWSTWKNAAMFAQAGMFSRWLIVGGLMLGMVIAAYVLMNRKSEPANPEFDTQNMAQYPAPDRADEQAQHFAAPDEDLNHANDGSMGNADLPDWAEARLDTAPTGRAPQARLELETKDGSSDVVQPAINVINQPSLQADVYSADSRNQSRAVGPSGYSNTHGDRPAARSAQRPNYERYDSSAARDYRDTTDRFNTGERFNSADSRVPAERREPRTDARYAPPINNSNLPNGAGFRGTIEPAPYRIR